MKLLLGKIKYDKFKWKLRGDIKVVALLSGMQLGYTKYCCPVSGTAGTRRITM